MSGQGSVGDAVTLCAPAKVNLFLAVGSTFSDGYHEVRTVLQALELADRVTVTPADRLEVLVEPDVGVHVEQNTAYRAAVAFGEAAGFEPTVTVRVEKRIPHAAGLGGGSADAAAVIFSLARMWGMETAGDTAMRAAASVGADVPFFLVGGAAHFDHKGERLACRLPSIPMDIVLVNPGVPTPTPDVYRAFDSLLDGDVPGGTGVAALRAVSDALRARDTHAVACAVSNGLAPAAIAVAPQIAGCLSWLDEQPGVLRAEVSGSGATVFGICADAPRATAAAAGAAEMGWWSAATTTRDAGVGPCGGMTRDEG